jgi:hypothetical protein
VRREHDRGGLRSGGPPVCAETRATQGCCRGRVELREGGGLRRNGPEKGLLGRRTGRTAGMLRRARAGRRAVSYSWDSATVHPASMPWYGDRRRPACAEAQAKDPRAQRGGGTMRYEMRHASLEGRRGGEPAALSSRRWGASRTYVEAGATP